MDKITIGDIITKLNPEIIYKEYIINVKDNKLINSNKSIEEYVSLINESNIEINIETIDELNTALFREDESISTTSLLYMNFKENKTDKIYFYSFQGFSDTFIRNYKNTYAYSYLKFLLDGFLKEGTINNNIDDYLTIKTREYIEYIVRTISVRKNKRVNPVKSNISNLFDEINYISTLTYEGISVSAKLAICNETLINKFTKCFMKLDNPIYFGDYRKIRKLLEMSDKHTYLIGDSEKVYGLGKFANFKNFPSDILIFIFDFIGKFEYKINTLSIINSTVKEDKNADKEIIKWSSEECNIVNIKYGKPDLRESKYCETMLEQALEEIFPEFSKENNSKKLDTIKKVINYAINQKHGTAVVITKPDIAESEVTLLEEQSIKIKKIDISAADCYLESIISKITNIDGAIYIDTEASCHAIGVILDGLAKKILEILQGDQDIIQL
ncbi:hypothetical protein [Clostridium sp. OS1-26]|uniref:hypothetical protein n=1 Tax=Clostridium sp. OS1-26 TaxID=3070681 RepID=UPI0027DF304E|nr:hypothetical protein [Clostridium sp. OS1-26]WML34408.1 hypothetical protein RCG18_24500 [Clostridium sp. OS1-26]